jgi:hypothetical protein
MCVKPSAGEDVSARRAARLREWGQKGRSAYLWLILLIVLCLIQALGPVLHAAMPEPRLFCTLALASREPPVAHAHRRDS